METLFGEEIPQSLIGFDSQSSMSVFLHDKVDSRIGPTQGTSCHIKHPKEATEIAGKVLNIIVRSSFFLWLPFLYLREEFSQVR
jgi:hypothetical protein